MVALSAHQTLLIPSLSFHTHPGWLVHDPPSSSITFCLLPLGPGRNGGAEVGRKRLCLHLRSVSLAWATGGFTCSREGSLWQQDSFQLDSVSWLDIWRLLLSPGRRCAYRQFIATLTIKLYQARDGGVGRAQWMHWALFLNDISHTLGLILP